MITIKGILITVTIYCIYFFIRNTKRSMTKSYESYLRLFEYYKLGYIKHKPKYFWIKYNPFYEKVLYFEFIAYAKYDYDNDNWNIHLNNIFMIGMSIVIFYFTFLLLQQPKLVGIILIIVAIIALISLFQWAIRLELKGINRASQYQFLDGIIDDVIENVYYMKDKGACVFDFHHEPATNTCEHKIAGYPFLTSIDDIPVDQYGEPYTFVAQINCEDIEDIEECENHHLPNEGLLQFWVQNSNNPNSPKKGFIPCRVIHRSIEGECLDTSYMKRYVSVLSSRYRDDEEGISFDIEDDDVSIFPSSNNGKMKLEPGTRYYTDFLDGFRDTEFSNLIDEDVLVDYINKNDFSFDRTEYYDYWYVSGIESTSDYLQQPVMTKYGMVDPDEYMDLMVIDGWQAVFSSYARYDESLTNEDQLPYFAFKIRKDDYFAGNFDDVICFIDVPKGGNNG